MATLNGLNYNKNYVAVPSSKAGMGEINGRIRMIYDSITLTAESASGDIVKVGKLPAGARVLSWRVLSPDQGGSGTIGFGWAASDDAVEAAQAAGFISAGDNSGQAYLGIPVVGALGLGKKFASGVDVQLVLGTSASGTGTTIATWIEYVLD